MGGEEPLVVEVSMQLLVPLLVEALVLLLEEAAPLVEVALLLRFNLPPTNFG